MASKENPESTSNKMLKVSTEPISIFVEYSFDDHEANVAYNVEESLDKPEYSDITFVVEEQEIFCHKAVLASSCGYFHTMFQSELTDSKKIEIKTMSYDDFLAIVSFVYTGKIQLALENAQMLLQHADMMEYADLKQVIQTFFADNLQADNTLGIHSMAVKLHAATLEKNALKFAVDNFQSIKDEEEFLQYTADEMGTYLGHADLNCPTENMVCSALIKWFQQNPDERSPSLKSLLFHLRLNQLSPEFVHFDLLHNPKLHLSHEISEFLQSLVLSNLFLSPMPSEIPVHFPRTKTDLADGIAIISTYGPRGIQVKLCHYEYNPTVVKEIKTINCEQPCGYNVDHTITNICSSNKFLYLSGIRKKSQNYFENWTSFFYRLELSSNQWLALKPIAEGYVIQVTPYKGELLGVTYKSSNDGVQFQSVQSYCHDHIRWKVSYDFEQAISKENRFAVITHRNFLFLLGIKPKVPNEESTFTAIVCTDLESKATAVLTTQLSANISILRALVYRGHVIIVTEQSDAEGKVYFQTIPVQDLQKDFYDKKNGIETEGVDLSTCVNAYIETSLYKLGDTLRVELVGNQLLILRQNTASVLRIYAIDAEDVKSVNGKLKRKCVYSIKTATLVTAAAVRFSRVKDS